MLTQDEKKKLNAALDEKATTDNIISFRDVALECGFKHIKTEQVKGFATSFVNRHPNYKAVHMVKDSQDTTTSLFVGLTFVDKNIDFEED